MSLRTVCAALAALASVPAFAGDIAVTIDDLPLQRMAQFTTADAVAVNKKLVAVLRHNDIPAVGFVNEGKLEVNGRPDPARVAILERWLDSGLELGNHGYAHQDLHRVDAKAFEDDVRRGERITRPLAEQRGRPYRYFRYPYLHTGRDLATRGAVQSFLADNAYTVAPVTIDNSEWIFAAAYDKAWAGSDQDMEKRLGKAYLDYMLAKTEYFERNSRDLFKRHIPQVLLIHDNRLNADWFGALADRLEQGGRSFITLEDALADPAYDSDDTWTGAGGISWLHRWALAKGVPKSFFEGEPRTPQWVMDYSGIHEE